MSIWYALLSWLPFSWAQYRFMLNALLAVLVMAPLFGILSTNIVTGKMSFFSDALGHSAFTGIAVGVLCGMSFPIFAAVLLAIAFSFLFSYVKANSRQSADTIIGVFSSAAVALGIFISTMGGGSFTKFNRYLIGDILSVTPLEIGLLLLILAAVVVIWVLFSGKFLLTTLHPQLAASRGINTLRSERLFTTVIAVVVTMAISWVGLLVINSLLILPAAGSRNVARNMRQYFIYSVGSAGICGVLGLFAAYYLGCSAGAAISLLLTIYFAVTFCFRKKNG